MSGQYDTSENKKLPWQVCPTRELGALSFVHILQGANLPTGPDRLPLITPKSQALVSFHGQNHPFCRSPQPSTQKWGHGPNDLGRYPFSLRCEGSMGDQVNYIGVDVSCVVLFWRDASRPLRVTLAL